MAHNCIWKLTLSAALLSSTAAFAQEDRTVRIVLNEELDVVEPCMAARSDVGRVILQNVNETLTEFVPGQTELKPRLATRVDPGRRRHLAHQASRRRHLPRRHHARRGGRRLHPRPHQGAGVRLRGRRQVLRRHRVRHRGRRRPDRRGHHHARLADPAAPALDRADRAVRDPGRRVRTRSRSAPAPTSSTSGTPARHRPEAQPGLLGRGAAGRGGDLPLPQRPGGRRGHGRGRRGRHRAEPFDGPGPTNPETDFSYPNSETTTLRIDTTMPPTDDRRIREAMNLAIDREAFVGSLFPADVQPATQMVVPTTIGYNPDLKVWPYDPEPCRGGKNVFCVRTGRRTFGGRSPQSVTSTSQMPVFFTKPQPR